MMVPSYQRIFLINSVDSAKSESKIHCQDERGKAVRYEGFLRQWFNSWCYFYNRSVYEHISIKSIESQLFIRFQSKMFNHNDVLTENKPADAIHS